MNPYTKTALQESLAHWKRMRAFTLEDFQYPIETPEGPYCALCQRFRLCKHDGELCPVYDAVGQPGCYGTPWSAARNAFFSLAYHYLVAAPITNLELADKLIVWHAAADKEIAFLESLLPQTATTTNNKRETINYAQPPHHQKTVVHQSVHQTAKIRRKRNV